MTMPLLYTVSFNPQPSPQGSLDVITAPHSPSLSQNPLCSAWASFQIPSSPPHIWSTAGGGHGLGVSIISSVSTGCKVEAGESRIWNGEIIFRATDQCKPLSSCTPYFSRRWKTSLLAHMQLLSIRVSELPCCTHSEQQAGARRNRRSLFDKMLDSARDGEMDSGAVQTARADLFTESCPNRHS